MANIVEGISNNVRQILRYVFPGFVVVGAAYLGHLDWFTWFKPENGSHLIILATTAAIVGNVWFAIHRYVIHQTIDFIFYFWGSEGPAGTKGHRGFRAYAADLSKYVVHSFQTAPKEPVREHVALRTSQMHLMYIASEAFFLFSLWNEDKSFFSKSPLPWLWPALASIIFALTLWQNYITRRIDALSIGQVPAMPERTKETENAARLPEQKLTDAVETETASTVATISARG